MATSSTSKSTPSAPICIDLGKQKRKRIKRLRKGRGRLFTDANETIESLKNDGTVDKNAQVVYLVVREKKRDNYFG